MSPAQHIPATEVFAIGMTTSLGPSAAASCAAARAGISRMRPLDHLTFAAREGEMTVTVGCFAGPADSGFSGPGRLVELARTALADLDRGLPVDALCGQRVLALLVLPDHQHELARIAAECRDLGPHREAVAALRTAQLEEVLRADRRALEATFAAALEARGAKSAAVQSWHGPAGFASASLAATAALREDRATVCLIGAFDSLLDTETLDALHAIDLLKAPDHPTGLIPGEAGVVLLSRIRRSVAPGLPALATIDEVAVDGSRLGEETSVPEEARRLAKVVQACLPAVQQPLQLLADLNGDERRSSEWGHAAVCGAWPRHATANFPATAFGDTGSAAGAVATVMAIHGWTRRVRGPAHCIVTLSEVQGTKAALRLSAPSPT